MTESSQWLLYGANGYTGRLIAQLAVKRGARPVLAGRSRAQVEPLAQQLGCPWRVFSLEDPAAVAMQLEGVSAVLHCAGPFCDTARPMVDACLSAHIHYLDITGEYEVIEWAREQDGRARAAGVIVMPAVGMDVVPSDCLAALLARGLPDADRLVLALAGPATLSPGTAHTIWRNIARGGRARREGKIVHTPAGTDFREIVFPSGPRPTMPIPWGDIAAAHHTTGIANIEVRLGLLPHQAAMVRRWQWLLPAAGLAPVQALGRWWIRRHISGPGEAELAEGHTEFWGCVSSTTGGVAEATLITPNGYRLTAEAAWAIVQRVVGNQIQPGFHTPAEALGGEFIHQLPGTQLQWRKGYQKHREAGL